MVFKFRGRVVGGTLAVMLLAANALAADVASKALITQVQKRLAELGYKPGAANGKVGAQTQTAIREYQETVGLRATGVPSEELLRQLSAPCEVSVSGGSRSGIATQPTGGCKKVKEVLPGVGVIDLNP